MIYTTGTIAISGNTLTGTGTNFTAAGLLIRNGCTVIALTSPAQVFQITAIGSATSLTVTPTANPAIPAGTKYAILLSDSLSVDGLAQDIAETFTMYQRYMSGFADVMNGTTDVTITINGVAVTVPGQKSLAKKGANSDITSLSGLTTALSISQGGTGAKNAADARTNLGLGSSATRNIIDSPTSLTADAVLVPGYRGIGLPTLGGGGGDTVSIYQNFNGSGFYTIDGSRVTSQNIPNWWHPSASGNVWGGGVYISRTSVQVIEFLASRDGKAGIRVRRDSTVDPVQAEFYTTLNTTKASDGTLKAASPIVKIFHGGRYETNAESEGVTVTRLEVGRYLIEGCLGLKSDTAWGGIDGGFDIPTDRNKQPLIWLDYEVNADGSVLVKTYHRTHPEAPAFARNELQGINEGDPVDIPSDQFVSVRVQMPQNSIWNQCAAMAEVPDSSAD
ncbi:phage tail protein [Enterobacter kobei]|uniref:phage tail fiber protein n=1 Tax=Enterobacter kobei TaxID=208224 RepID=UPI00331048A6|nr:phage tail protein [Enterobacter kobei]